MILITPALLLNLNGVSIHQFDVADRLIIFSTSEQKVFLLNLDDSQLTQIGNITKKKKKNTNDSFKSCGVCTLSTYRLVKLNSFQYDDDYNYNVDDDENSQYPEPLITKAYRLINIECQLFVSRPKCRLWVVDIQGVVLYTHQFSKAVQQTICSTMFGDQEAIEKIFKAHQINNYQQMLEPFNFVKLYSMYWRDPYDSLKVHSYVATFITNEDDYNSWSQIFVIDLNRSIIVASSLRVKGEIIELKCVGNNIFVSYYRNDSSMLAILLLTLCAKGNSMIQVKL